jgi:hypothetical protein
MAALQAGPNVGLNYVSSGLQNGLPGHSKGAHDKARKSVELQLPANFQSPAAEAQNNKDAPERTAACLAFMSVTRTAPRITALPAT